MQTRKNMQKQQKQQKQQKPQKPWGQHMILDVERCNPEHIRNPRHIKAFVKAMVAAVGMKAYGPPRVVMFGTGRRKGYTLVQLIETSDITCHFSEQDNSAYFDLFSCKPFDESKAKNVFIDYFEPERVHAKVFQRGGHTRYSKTRFQGTRRKARTR